MGTPFSEFEERVIESLGLGHAVKYDEASSLVSRAKERGELQEFDNVYSLAKYLCPTCNLPGRVVG